MKKGYLVGGLAVLGAIALFAYLKKPKRNRDGFYGATGSGRLSRTSKATRGNCAYCRDSQGGVYHTGEDRTCSGRDVCVTRYSYLS